MFPNAWEISNPNTLQQQPAYLRKCLALLIVFMLPLPLIRNEYICHGITRTLDIAYVLRDIVFPVQTWTKIYAVLDVLRNISGCLYRWER